MQKKILFADDETDVRTVVDILLKRAGYEVMLHADESFLESIEDGALPDLYLLDRRLGKVDAIEICYLLKSHARTKHIPVVMISADPAIKDVYKAAGADACISKPFEIQYFLDVVAKLLNSQ